MKSQVNFNENGFVTIWLLGLAIIILFLGGLSLDLWSNFAERRELAAITDAAAVAGASGIDLDHYKESGEIRLDPAESRARSSDYLERETSRAGIELIDYSVQVLATNRVEVTARQATTGTFSRVLIRDLSYEISVRSVAEPMK